MITTQKEELLKIAPVFLKSPAVKIAYNEEQFEALKNFCKAVEDIGQETGIHYIADEIRITDPPGFSYHVEYGPAQTSEPKSHGKVYSDIMHHWIALAGVL